VEWSVPSDQKSSADSWFDGCDVNFSFLPHYVSWTDALGNERYQQEPGQVDRLWVLNVNGQRLLIDATHSRFSSGADVAEQTQLVESIHFDR